MPITVKQLIARAQEHLSLRGDDLVGVVIYDENDANVLHVEPATAVGYDQYDDDGPVFFEIEAKVTE